MPSKFSVYAGKITEGPKAEAKFEVRALADALRLKLLTLDDITKDAINTDKVRAELKAADDHWKLRKDALNVLLHEHLESSEMDSVSMNGYTFSRGYEPYPTTSGSDLDEILNYFKDNGMEDRLSLSATEIASRLESIVKEEVANNELESRTIARDDGTTETAFYSRVPGVRVWLLKKLNRRKQ